MTLAMAEFIGELSTQTLTGLVSLAEARPGGVARMPGDGRYTACVIARRVCSTSQLALAWDCLLVSFVSR